MKGRRTLAAGVVVAGVLCVWPGAVASAADEWIEVKSAHFTVVSNAGERTTRRLVWQLEQVRSATAAVWSWARADLNKPLSVIALKDENSMRALAPRYWEERRSVRPASVWVTGPDRHYLALRTDVEVDDRETINPYITAYSSYVSLILNQSIGRTLPLWLSRGYTGVLSNTVVRDDHVLIGAPIPWELRILRERPLWMLPKLLSFTHQSPEAAQAEPREVYDAETWAFVHFLMYGEEGKHAAKLNAYATLVNGGKDPTAALAETLGPVEAFEGPFRRYIQRNVFTYRRLDIDVSVERERFPVRVVPAAESASLGALFHAAMGRPAESRIAIAEARKADPKAAESFAAEGLLFDREKKPDDAKAAYSAAAGLGSTNPYVYYRLASIAWQPNASRETLVEIEKHLTMAVTLNTRYAAAYAWLGEVRAFLGNPEAMSLIRRAIELEPHETSHRLRAAGLLMRQGKPAEARADAQVALAIAEDDGERRQAQELLDSAAKLAAASASGAEPSATPGSSPSSRSIPAAAGDPAAMAKACQSGDEGACGRLMPALEAECARRNGSACGFAASLYERGRGVAADPVRAADFYRQSCDAAERRGCLAFAMMQTRGDGVPKDAVKSQAALTQLCTDGMPEACAQLALQIVAGGTAADVTRARELLTKACDGRHAPACELLKSMPNTPK